MKYFKIFAMHCKLALMSSAIYRANFILGFIQGTINSLLGVICIDFIYGSVESIAGWNKQEMIILVCTANIVIFGLFCTYIRPNQDKFLRGISKGDFDRMIIKPLNLLFQINIGPADIISNIMFCGVQIIIIIIQIGELGTQIGIIQILLYILFILNGVLIFAAFQLLLYSLAFVYIRIEGLENIFYNIIDIADRPKEIFSNKYVKNIFIFVIPVIPIANAPAAVLVRKSSLFEMLCYLGASIILSVLAVIALRLGMRRYNSASS